MPLDATRTSSHLRAVTPRPLTAAAALAIIDAWEDLPIATRRTWRSAVRVLSRALGLPLEAIPMDPILLNSAMESVTAAMVRINGASFKTYKTSIRLVLRRLGLLPANRPLLTQAWQDLYDVLPDRFMRMGLRHFLAYTSSRGLTPDQVDRDTIVAFGEHLLMQVLRRKPDAHVRRVVRVWNSAIGTVPGWPQTRLIIPAKLTHYTLPLACYPLNFQAELQTLATRLSGANQKGLYTGDGPPKPLSPATVKSRLYSIRQAAAALVLLGRDPASITSLAALVEKDAFKAIMDFYFKRSGGRRTSMLSGIASALVIVARYHCKFKGKKLLAVRALAKPAMMPRRTSMTEKNASRLSYLDDAHIEARLICLPKKLMQEAQRFQAQGRPRDAAWTAAVAVGVKILLVCPLRLKNLVGLRLDTNLLRLDHKKDRVTHLRIPDKDVKNNQAIEWIVHPDTSKLIQCYLDEFRPLLPYTDNVWLFPGRYRGDRLRDSTGLSQAISHAIRKHVGIEMHVHLFRAYAAKILLEDSPEALDDLRQLLGHKGLETTLIYYVHFRGKAISKRFNGLIFGKEEQATCLLAAAQRSTRSAP